MEEKTFIEKLDELMKSKNVSRKTLADAIGVSRATIDTWFMRGEDNPNKNALLAIAKYFGVSVYYLCDNTCSKSPLSRDNIFAKYLAEGELLALHDDEVGLSDLTEDEVVEVMNFIDFIKSKRKTSIEE